MRLIEWFLYNVLRFVLFLRYRIEVRGLEDLDTKNLSKPGGILFLANHPAEIDPCILLKILWPSYRVHPVAVEYLFHIPFIGYLLRLIGAIAVPSFEASSNSFKRFQIEKAYKRIFSLIDHKENLLIYPAGGLKDSGEEIIGGASGVHHILQQCPDVNVVLVRTTGLWGSSFSKALTGKTPELIPTFLAGLKVILRNFIFFVPKRRVLVEFEAANKDIPLAANRVTFNRFLEDWYNKNGPEPINLVSFSRWKKVYPEILEKPVRESVSIDHVSDEIRNAVIEEIAKLARKPSSRISYEDDLSKDLGLDSLDAAQLIALLKDQFNISEVQARDLTTVGTVIAYAGRLKEGEAEKEEEVDVSHWDKHKKRPRIFYPEGKTLPEIFLTTCGRMGKSTACVDQMSGEVSYRKLKIAVLLLANAIAKLPGERIGIMLPACTAVNIAAIACMIAKKVPVMINWTLGPSTLKATIDQSKIEKTLSSWNFLNHLDNAELNGLDEQFILLEEMKGQMTWKDRLKAIWLSLKSTDKILKAFHADAINEEDTAVILFTSGTESVPKGVPLSHKNLIVNQKGAFELITIKEDDIFLSTLPPFHSFGFSVTGLLPLMAGLRVVYSPNPTDGRKLATLIEKRGVTLLCLAPTFLKNIIRIATVNQMRSLRLVVTGAEKTHQEVFDKMRALNPSAYVIEGYGITECAPILSLNIPGKPMKGVGFPLPNVKFKIIHPETFELLPSETQGLVLAAGPNVFKGYLDASLPSPFLELQGTKWYVTGDLGSLDQEGYLTLCGRLKRFAKIGGEMISLNAIEEVLNKAAKTKPWPVDPDQPFLAVAALEEEGRKTEICLFTTFDTSLEEVNKILKESGMSNLIRIRSIKKFAYIPLLGTGKVDYRALVSKLKA